MSNAYAETSKVEIKGLHELTEALEALVDRFTYADVIDRLSSVGFLKAQHLTENWQDSNTAKAWEKAAMRVDAAQSTARNAGI